jgi:acetyl esterase/lipase
MKTYTLLIITALVTTSLLFSCHTKKKKHEEEEAYLFKGKEINNIVFAEQAGQDSIKQNIDLDLYLPSSADSGKQYPLTVFIHGGAFRTGEKEDGKVFCEMLADKGFAVASVNYRTGWEKGKDPCQADTNGIKLAVYRALQDSHAALRYLTANASKYAVDTNWVFMSGTSAGSILSLATIYYPQDSANVFFGSIADTLGLLDSYGNNFTTHYTIKGIAAMWGGLNNPFLLTKNNAVPAIFFHGEKDNVVPYNISHFYNCDNLFPSYGTKPLYDRLVELGVPAVAYIDPAGGHGVYSDIFRAETIAGFFNSIMKKEVVQTGFHVEAPATVK